MAETADFWTEQPNLRIRVDPPNNGLVRVTIYEAGEEPKAQVDVAFWRWQQIVKATMDWPPQG